MASERAVTGAFEASALSHGFASAHAELAGDAPAGFVEVA